MARESTVKGLGLEALTQDYDCVLRNNLNGTLYTGKLVNFEKGVATIKGASIYKTGIKGYPDTTGYFPIVITPDMVGLKVALFCAFEWKRSEGGVISPEQQKWLDRMVKDGAVAGAPASLEEAISLRLKFGR